MRTLETDITPLDRARIWNQLMQMNLLMRDFDSAQDAAVKVVEVGLTTPDYPITNVVTDKDNLCQMTFFVKRDYEAASSCMSAPEAAEFAEICDNNTGVNIYSVQALAAREADNLDTANQLTDRALAYDINPDKHHVAALAEAEVYAVMIKSDLGLWDEAPAIIARATRKKGGHKHQNIKLMQAYVELRRTGPEVAIDYLKAQAFSQRRSRYFFRMVYVMDEMADLGLDWDAVPAPPSRRRR